MNAILITPPVIEPVSLQDMKKTIKKVGKIPVECDFCGVGIFIFSCHVKLHKHHFCGVDCKNKWRREHMHGELSPRWEGGPVKVKCGQCGGDLERSKAEIKEHKVHFCSKECDGKWRSENRRGVKIYNWTGGPVKVSCDQCGVEVLKARYKVKAYDHHFCGRACMAMWHSENMGGEKAYQWRGGARAGRERLKTNLKARINARMSTAIGISLKGNKNGQGWENLVGYTAKDLILSLKKTMPKGYTWEDFLSGELEIDHIIPCKVFNFETPDDLDFKKCWDIRNLRLLHKIKNRSKGGKIEKPFQPSLAMAVMSCN